METSALTFGEPLWLAALVLVPVFGGLYWSSQRRGDRLVARIVAPRLREELVGSVSRGLRAVRATLILAALACIAAALARPQMGFVETEVKQRGRDVIIAIDTSRSMLATDIAPTRLARAKLFAIDLLRLVKGDRVGIVAFAGSAFLQTPLTLDEAAVSASLDELDTTIIPKGGTNIAAAIRAAEEAFGKGGGQVRALIILTDGEELDADGIAAAKSAATKGVRIFTVGIGSKEGSLIPVKGETGGTDFVRDSAGKPVQSRLDETRLQEIAGAAGGFYESLGPDAARIVFEKGIQPIAGSVAGTMTSRQPVEKYQWPLGAAIALLALWMVVGEKRRAPRRSALAAASLLVALAGARATDGLAEYRAGNYEKAKEAFQHGLRSAPGSVKLEFNTGAAAYKLGAFGEAVGHFTRALETDDNKLREEASYNLANSLVRRGEAAKGNDEKKSDWKNAIQHYTEALNIAPQNTLASENRDIVKKLLEELEKQEQQKQDQEKKDDQKKDQKDQKDQQKPDKGDQQKDKKDQQDQQKQQDQQDQSGQDQKDQQQQSGDQKKDDQQKKDDEKKQGGQGKQDDQKKQDQSGGQKDQEKKDEEKKDQQAQGGQPQKPGEPGESNSKDQANAQPSPTPGEKKQGELKSGDKPEDKPQGDQAAGEAAAQAAEEKDGEMSAAQARALLNSLRSDEERVRHLLRSETQETLKDW